MPSGHRAAPLTASWATTDERPDTLKFGLLGSLEVRRGGELLALEGVRRRALLVRLLLGRNHVVSSSTLIEDIWQGRAGRGALSTLQSHVSLLRKVLGTDRLKAQSGGYVLLVSDDEFDVCEFEATVSSGRAFLAAGGAEQASTSVERALALWRGAALTDVAGSAWAQGESTRLEELRLDAVELLLEARLSLRDYAFVVARAEAEVVGNPLRERLWSLLMLALYRSGRQGDSLRAYRRLRHVLGEELGIEPSSALADLEEAILLQKPDLDQPQPQRSPVSLSLPSTVSHELPALPGRKKQLEYVGRLCRDSLPTGPGHILLVDGEPGVGVTTLLRSIEVMYTASPGGVSVLTAFPSATSIHSLRSLFTSEVTAMEGGQVGEHDLALYEISSWARDAGALMIVDDVDDLDRWSIELLVRLARRPPPGVVAVLGAPSLDRLADDADGRLAAIASSASTAHLHLPQLDQTGVRDMVRMKWPGVDDETADGWATHLMDWCDGNPWLVNRLLDSVSPTDDPTHIQPPPAIELSVRQRVREMPTTCRQLLLLAAALGGAVDIALLAAVAKRAVADVVESLAPAVDAGLLRTTTRPGCWQFDHRLTSESLSDEADRTKAIGWHATAGRLLRTIPGREAEAARHLAAGVPLVDVDDAREACTTAGISLLAQGHYSEAATSFEKAASLSSRPEDLADALIGQARGLELAGHQAESETVYDAAADTAIAVRSNERLAQAALGGSACASRVGGTPSRRARLQLAWSTLHHEHPRRGEVAAELALELTNSRTPLPSALEATVAQIAQRHDASNEGILAARVMLARAEAGDGADLVDASRLVALARQGATLSHHAAAALVVAIVVALSAGDWDSADMWTDELTVFGRHTGEPRARWQATALRSVLSEARGDALEADRLATEAMHIGERLGMTDAAATFGLHQLGRAHRNGSLGPFATALESANSRYRTPVWIALRAAAELDACNERSARALLRASAQQLEADSTSLIDHFRTAALALTCQVATRLGETDVTKGTVAALQRRTGRFVVLGYGGPCLGPVDWYLAESAAFLGDSEMADDLLRTAQTTCRNVRAYAWLSVVDALRSCR
jgi:DNA-binding SARP family transcriptional activator